MAPAKQPPSQLADIFEFRPKWWWDPVPDWVITHLDQRVVLEISKVVLEVQAEMFERQAEATRRIAGLMGPARGK